MTMKSMLDTSFPGINVVLENYPPPFPKRVLGKIVPFIQVGAIATLMAGDQIFPRFGMVPPPWYYSLRANRFGTMASIWLFGNFAQSLLQSSGAFEVYCNGQLVCFYEYTLCYNSWVVIFSCAIHCVVVKSSDHISVASWYCSDSKDNQQNSIGPPALK
jgi:selT/selW/selH-like putative selenoprotein